MESSVEMVKNTSPQQLVWPEAQHLVGKLDADTLKKCIYPGETGRFVLAVIIVLPIVAFYIYTVAITEGVTLVAIPTLFFSLWFFTRVLRATLLGSAVEISPDNFPEVHEILNRVCDYLDYSDRVEAYVYQNGDVNAFLLNVFRSRIILLPHELLCDMLEGKGRTELIWILARSVGHLKAKHLRLWWIKTIIEGVERLAILNFFLYPWERSIQYSGDRIGLAVCANLEAATLAMSKLIVGNTLSRKVNPLGMLKQHHKIRRSFFGWLTEAFSPYPHMTSRKISLILWSKSYNPKQYEQFISQQANSENVKLMLELEEPVLSISTPSKSAHSIPTPSTPITATIRGSTDQLKSDRGTPPTPPKTQPVPPTSAPTVRQSSSHFWAWVFGIACIIAIVIIVQQQETLKTEKNKSAQITLTLETEKEKSGQLTQTLEMEREKCVSAVQDAGFRAALNKEVEIYESIATPVAFPSDGKLEHNPKDSSIELIKAYTSPNIFSIRSPQLITTCH